MEPLPFMRLDASQDCRASAAGALRMLRRRRLSNEMIKNLVAVLQVERSRDKIVDAWPTAGQDRQAIIAVRDACKAFESAIGGLSPRAQAEFATASLAAFGHVVLDSAAASAMRALGGAMDARLAKMPKQSRRAAFANIVDAVAHAVAPLRVTVSPSRGRPVPRHLPCCIHPRGDSRPRSEARIV